MSDTSEDAGTANGYEEPVNWARIAVLISVALPATSLEEGEK